MNNSTFFCSVCERTYQHREVLRDGLFDDVAPEKRERTRDRMAALLLEHSVPYSRQTEWNNANETFRCLVPTDSVEVRWAPDSKHFLVEDGAADEEEVVYEGGERWVAALVVAREAAGGAARVAYPAARGPRGPWRAASGRAVHELRVPPARLRVRRVVATVVDERQPNGPGKVESHAVEQLATDDAWPGFFHRHVCARFVVWCGCSEGFEAAREGSRQDTRRGRGQERRKV